MDSIAKAQRTLQEYTTLTDLKSGVVSGSYSPAHPDFSRCFLWKTTLLLQTVDPAAVAELRSLRSTYRFLENEHPVPFLQLPEGSPYYVPSKTQPTPIERLPKKLATQLLKKTSLINSKSKRKTPSDLPQPLGPTSKLLNGMHTPTDPLSRPTASRNKRDVDELNTIILDVERAFPGVALYQDITVRKRLALLLYVWYKVNQEIGYRQGMHEIVAVIYHIVSNESVERTTEGKYSDNSSSPGGSNGGSEYNFLCELFDQDFILADTFHMFCIFMINPQASFYVEKNLLQACLRFDALLRGFDYDLHCYFTEALRLESQIWLVRWFRLLLLRELTLPVALPLWDKLVSFQRIKQFSNLTSNADFNEIVATVVMVLLVRIKRQLVVGCLDYGDVLKLLLNYPAEDVFDFKLENIMGGGESLFDETSRDARNVADNVNELFNEAVLVFNSRDNLEHVGKFLNEKHDNQFVLLNQQEQSRIATQQRKRGGKKQGGDDGQVTFIRNEAILDKLRFENRLKDRVKRVLKK